MKTTLTRQAAAIALLVPLGLASLAPAALAADDTCNVTVHYMEVHGNQVTDETNYTRSAVHYPGVAADTQLGQQGTVSYTDEGLYKARDFRGWTDVPKGEFHQSNAHMLYSATNTLGDVFGDSCSGEKTLYAYYDGLFERWGSFFGISIPVQNANINKHKFVRIHDGLAADSVTTDVLKNDSLQLVKWYEGSETDPTGNPLHRELTAAELRSLSLTQGDRGSTITNYRADYRYHPSIGNTPVQLSTNFNLNKGVASVVVTNRWVYSQGFLNQSTVDLTLQVPEGLTPAQEMTGLTLETYTFRAKEIRATDKDGNSIPATLNVTDRTVSGETLSVTFASAQDAARVSTLVLVTEPKNRVVSPDGSEEAAINEALRTVPATEYTKDMKWNAPASAFEITLDSARSLARTSDVMVIEGSVEGEVVGSPFPTTILTPQGKYTTAVTKVSSNKLFFDFIYPTVTFNKNSAALGDSAEQILAADVIPFTETNAGTDAATLSFGQVGSGRDALFAQAAESLDALTWDMIDGAELSDQDATKIANDLKALAGLASLAQLADESTRNDALAVLNGSDPSAIAALIDTYKDAPLFTGLTEVTADHLRSVITVAAAQPQTFTTFGKFAAFADATAASMKAWAADSTKLDTTFELLSAAQAVTVNSPLAVPDVLVTDAAGETIRYRFTGWNTAPDGSGTPFTELSDIRNDLTVYAQWEQVRRPEFTVTFYAVDRTGAPLPNDVMAGIEPLPGPVTAPKGSDVPIPERQVTRYALADGSGTWSLVHTITDPYNDDQQTIRNIQQDTSVTWVWAFTPNAKVTVDFAFVDEAGDALPAQVLAAVSPVPDPIEVYSGQNVTPPVLTTSTYSMADGSGTWALHEQPAPLMGVTASTTVNYVWRFTEATKHPVVFQFADEDGNALPAEVLAAVGPVPPSAEVYEGQDLTPPTLTTTSYDMADHSGTWSLVAQPAALTNVTAPATVTYVWRFVENAKITVDFAFVDEEGNALPAEALAGLGPVPSPAQVYSGADLTPPVLSTTSYSMADGSGRWSLTAQPAALSAVTEPATVNYVWRFVENAKVTVDFRFVDTAGRALPAEVLAGVGPVPAAVAVYPGQAVTPPVLSTTSYSMADGSGTWSLVAQLAALSAVTEPATVDYVWQFTAKQKDAGGKDQTTAQTTTVKAPKGDQLARTGVDLNAVALATVGFFAAGALVIVLRRKKR